MQSEPPLFLLRQKYHEQVNVFPGYCHGSDGQFVASLPRSLHSPWFDHFHDRQWRERFLTRRKEAVQLYDERFARMWEFYLACSEMAFRKQDLMNFQIQLTNRPGVVPMTREYIFQAEAKLRAIESGRRPWLKMAGG
jgi:hypothetical protein